MRLLPFVVGIALLQTFAYGVTYGNTKQLDPNYVLSWNLSDTHIFLKLNVSTTGWIGFGIGEPTSGSMPGADIVTVTVNGATNSITDRYTFDKVTPSTDSCQDWKLLTAQETNGRTIAEIYRKLVTEDAQDRPIVSGENRIIFAYGASDSFEYHGANRGATALTFWGEAPVTVNTTNPTVLHWDLNATSYLIPAATTTYASTSLILPYQNGPFHIIGFEPVIDPRGAAHVHHFVLRYCSTSTPWFEFFLNGTANQADAEVDGYCPGQIWAWAPGMAPYALPEIAGFRVGNDTNDFHYLNLEIHYDNPSNVAGIRDSSGVRIYYTRNLRQHDAGVFTIGDPYVSNPTVMDPNTVHHFEYDCPEVATQRLPMDLVFFGSFLHMHAVGKQTWTTHWRNGTNIGTINRIDFWDFGFQQTTNVSFVLKAGDRLNHHCIYNTKDRTTPTIFGMASHDEMCMNFMSYYPRINAVDCGYYGRGPNGQNITMVSGEPIIVNDAPVPNPTKVDPPGADAITYGKAPTTCIQDTFTATTPFSSTDAESWANLVLPELGLALFFLLSM